MSAIEKIRTYIRNHRRLVSIGAPIILLLLFVGIILGIRYFSPEKEASTPVSPNEEKQEAAKPSLLPHLVNGVMVSPDVANRRPVAAMIENSQAARPQAGLTSADLIYEAVAEGGITRFMAIYSQTYPEKAGPIRSARSYYIDWLSEYDAVYVHAGGSPAALNHIRNYDIKDYPHSNDGTYNREPRPGVASEHTLFANIAKIFENSVSKKGWSASSDYQLWLFKDSPTTTDTAAGNLTIDFSSAPFKVVWSYDPTSNEYSRSMAGSAHKDRLSGDQIKAKTIAVMTVQRSANSPYADSGKESEWNMTTIGTGNAAIYRDGIEIKGTWKKPSRTERTRFYDPAGKEIEFNRGKIWVEVVPQTGSYSYQQVESATQ